MREKGKVVSALVFLLIVMVASFPGCSVSSARGSGNPDIDPFDTGRVATVRIIMKASDWATLKANAYAKDYYKADFWFDDELVADVGVRTKGNASLMETVHWNSDRFTANESYAALEHEMN